MHIFQCSSHSRVKKRKKVWLLKMKITTVWSKVECPHILHLDLFHQLNRRSGSCFGSPITSDDNCNPHTIEGGFIQISHVIIPKITPLNITYWCLFGDKMSYSSACHCKPRGKLIWMLTTLTGVRCIKILRHFIRSAPPSSFFEVAT